MINKNCLGYLCVHNEYIVALLTSNSCDVLFYSLADVVPTNDVYGVRGTSTVKIQVGVRESGNKMGVYPTATRDEVRVLVNLLHFCGCFLSHFCAQNHPNTRSCQQHSVPP